MKAIFVRWRWCSTIGTMTDFHEIDGRSSIFRYADPGPPGELWINFHQLQVVIGKLVEAFEEYLASR